MSKPSYKLIWPALLLAVAVQAMDMDDNSEFPHPNIVNAGSKTFHWLLTLFLSLIMPSFAAVLVLAERFHVGVVLQIVSLVYTVVDVLFLSFPDGQGVENRTSRGTGVFLMLVNGACVFFGLFNSGSNFVNKENGTLRWVRQLSDLAIKKIHYFLSVILVLTGWVKTCLAPVAMFGFCRDVHTGQCLAHGIMGSAFIGYGFVYLMILVVPFFRNSSNRQSQEFYDSLVMMVWGIVNTFTEHRWGTEPWSMSDYQHTVSGILWWTGGLVGLYLSRGGRRSFMPALMLIFTGWAMSEHTQHLEISTKIHYMFGLVLIVGGVTRIVEISFLVKDKRGLPDGVINSFQYLPSFCLMESGVLFMGANEEQLELVLGLGSEHSAYILLLTSATFMIYLWCLLLLGLYTQLAHQSQEDYLPFENGRSNDPTTEFELENLSE